jgi:hypothetical protein
MFGGAFSVHTAKYVFPLIRGYILRLKVLYVFFCTIVWDCWTMVFYYLDFPKTSEVKTEWKAEVYAALNLTGGSEKL